MKFRNDIQGLRAIAVLLVLIFHFNKYVLVGGFLGVDIFFVISGYLITSIISSKLENGKFNLKDFYISRVKRIVPAYFMVLILTAVFVALLFIYIDALNFRKAYMWSATFCSNIYFATLDTYFGAASSENPLLHTWTLSIEMQFYLFFPLFLMFIRKKYWNYVFIVIVILFLSYTEYNIFIGNKDKMYFSLLARIPEFLIGSIFSISNIKLEKRVSNYVSICSTLILIGSAFLISETSHFPGFIVLIPCFASIGILISNESWFNQNILSFKGMTFIGEISYSLYLYHWVILAFIRYQTMNYNLDSKWSAIALIFSFIFSILSYYVIEKKARSKSLHKSLGIVLGLGVLVVVGVFIIKPVNTGISSYPDKYISPNPIGLETHGVNYKFDRLRGDLYSNDTLLLIGDSHALFLNPFFDYLGKSNHLVVRSVTNDRYPCIPGIGKDIESKSYFDTYNSLVDRVIKFSKTAKFIVVAKQFEDETVTPSFKSAFLDFAKTLSENQTLILMSDVPVLSVNPIRANKGVTNKGIKINYKLFSPPQGLLDSINGFNNIKYFNVSSKLVSGDFPYYNDTIMYYDKGHLNIYGSLIYAKDCENEFKELIKQNNN